MNARKKLGLAIGLLTTASVLTGCSGGSTPTPAETAAASPPAASRTMAPPTNKNEEEGSSSSETLAGGGYGGGSTGGGSYDGGKSSEAGGMGMMAPPDGGGDGEESGMMSPGPGYSMDMGSEKNEEETNMNPYDMRSMASNVGKGEMGAMSGGYPGMSPGGGDSEEEYGSYPGMPGMGGGQTNNLITQFVNQNCASCHGAANPKGGLRLVGADGVATDPLLWQSVLGQLESGSMPPASAQRPNPTQLAGVISLLKTELQASGLGAEQDYLSKAKYFFSKGKEVEAVEYFYAHVLTVDEEEAKPLLANVSAFAAGKRPALTLRFAVGIVLEAPEDLDVKPIGTEQFGGAGGGGPGGMGRGGEYGGMPGSGAKAAENNRGFYDLTGDFGKELVSAFESRWAAGAMGTVFNEVVAAAPKPASNAGMGLGGMGMMGRGMGMESGDDFEGGMQGMGGGGGGAASRSEKIAADQSIKPGLLYVGTGSQQDLLKKATEAGVDGLFVFDVQATLNRRTTIVNNSTRLRLMLADGTAVASTKTLANTEIERAKMRGESNDDLATNIERLFAKFDETIALTPLPTINAAKARQRVQQLIHDKNVSNLQTLFETRLYHSTGALTIEEVETVYQIVLQGNEGVSLASGAVADRQLVVDDLVQQL